MFERENKLRRVCGGKVTAGSAGPRNESVDRRDALPPVPLLRFHLLASILFPVWKGAFLQEAAVGRDPDRLFALFFHLHSDPRV